jgi:hypothetical protein
MEGYFTINDRFIITSKLLKVLLSFLILLF